jgi:uncharacterized protein YciI
MNTAVAALLIASLFSTHTVAQETSRASTSTASASAAKPAFDAELAKRTGADERGMRQYVLVILKTGPTPETDPEKRKAMFAGHMANIGRLADAGKLAVAGPFGESEDGWRGLFIFAVRDIEEAKALTATDPVIIQGEMIAEYHPWYGSAAMMLVPELSKQLAKESL